jgi:hypothetical protein
MNELQLVRGFYAPEPPPDPDVVTHARALLSDGALAARRGRGRRRFGRRPRWAGRGALLRLGGSAVAVGATAAVVALVLQPAPAAPTPPAGTSPGASDPALTWLRNPPASMSVFRLPRDAAVGATAGPGADILLTAARTVAAAPQPESARYYVTPSVVGNFVRVGPKDDPYQVLELVGREFWAARSPRDGSPDMSQALSVQAATPADQAAWRRDGSPTTWKYVGQETTIADPVAASGFSFPLRAGTAPQTSMGAGYGEQQFQVGAENLSLSQLQQLPADPAALKQIVVNGGLPPGGDATFYLLMTVPAVLQMPVTPAVRAALYQVLAGLPGVRSIGTVTDVAGRQGRAVSYTARFSGCGMQMQLSAQPTAGNTLFPWCVVQQTLIVSQVNGMPLAEELRYAQLPPGATWSPPNGLFSYQVFGTPYWTNKDRPGRTKS